MNKEYLPNSYIKKIIPSSRKGRRSFKFSLSKTQKFVIGTILLSLTLFASEYQFGKSGLYFPILISVLTCIILYWALYRDLRDSEMNSFVIFVLPVFYNLGFGMFYFLTPPSVLTRFMLTAFYAFGIFSLFKSQNIFAVSSIKTISLLPGARIVSFVLTLLSFFFLINITYTLHANIFLVGLLVFFNSFFLIYHSLWTYALNKPQRPLLIWVLTLSACLIEAASILWFWPSSPTFIALFLTGFFYTIVGLSHIWFERRLFKGIMWEYVWVGCIVFFVLILFTPWGK